MPARERGFALVVVLWGLVFTSLLASQIAVSGRSEAQLAGNLKAAATAEAAADGAIFQTISHLLARGELRWRAPGSYRVTLGEVTLDIALENLAGRVNPNTASPELLRALLVAVGEPPSQSTSMADAIVTARDAQKLTDLDELGQVGGLTPALLAKLRPHLTLWWENDPDPAFADKVVLAAMRALGDTRPATGLAEQPIQVVSIVARATGRRGGRFVRHADALVNSAAPRLQWRIVAWNQARLD